MTEYEKDTIIWWQQQRIAELEEENKQLKVDARSDADVIRRLRERIKEPTP